jgi:peptidylprolyl isomerase
MTPRTPTLLVSVLLAAGLSACGGSSGGSDDLASEPSTAASAAPSAAAPSGASASCAPAPAGPTKVTGTTDLSKKPEIEVPDSPPPCNLVIGDIVEGTGTAAKPGDRLTMKYVGVLYSTGKQFDASWDRGQDFPFTLGAGEVIRGWDKGLVGMKVGGRRELILPPDMAYGDQGAGADIPPGATLIFVVDLVKIG